MRKEEKERVKARRKVRIKGSLKECIGNGFRGIAFHHPGPPGIKANLVEKEKVRKKEKINLVGKEKGCWWRFSHTGVKNGMIKKRMVGTIHNPADWNPHALPSFYLQE